MSSTELLKEYLEKQERDLLWIHDIIRETGVEQVMDCLLMLYEVQEVEIPHPHHKGIWVGVNIPYLGIDIVTGKKR